MKRQATKKAKVPAVREMKPEYDFSRGVRGKHAASYAKGTNVVVRDPDVAKVFSDSESVNESLRALLPIVARRRKRKVREEQSA
jgi:hypothetical protein